MHYVSDLATAMREAKQAAGDKNVLVHGAGIAQRSLTAGLLDEIDIDRSRRSRKNESRAPRRERISG